MFITQFSFFFFKLGLDNCVEDVSVDEPSDFDPFVSVLPSFVLPSRVLSNISSGIDCFILRLCQNIANNLFHYHI